MSDDDKTYRRWRRAGHVCERRAARGWMPEQVRIEPIGATPPMRIDMDRGLYDEMDDDWFAEYIADSVTRWNETQAELRAEAETPGDHETEARG